VKSVSSQTRVLIFKSSLVTLLATLIALTSGCTTTGGSGDPETRRRNIDTGVELALENLYRQVEGSRELVGQARGVLVFPDVLRGGFKIAAARGHGALRVGGTTRSYHTTTSGSFGLQAGVQSTAVFLLFMTDEALRRFEASTGWQVGADASVTVLAAGATATVSSTTAQQPVIGFVLSNRGLMAGISLDGSRIVRLDL
jgi:lipid-binding SYLF domain-containing protein